MRRGSAPSPRHAETGTDDDTSAETSTETGADATATRRADRGFTFTETVVTVVLLGVVIVPILAAVRASIRTSSVAEAAAQVETVLVNAADRVQRAPNVESDACDFARYAQAAAEAQEWDASSVQVTQQYLEGGQWISGPPTGPACPVTGNQLNLAKRITIRVTSPDNRVTRTIQVVKSDV